MVYLGMIIRLIVDRLSVILDFNICIIFVVLGLGWNKNIDYRVRNGKCDYI